ncbi:hypothetical protein Ocin01_06722 [Orchesella cincta]|uniref:Uncharacterized protein n=1 Tax=Orchesella cincta TaxID=48709 RepID=A0A1D2N4T8_ORCCI|nr:hypothetical protein Ocin01_06722 [Orchesella cincta]
MMEPMEAGGYMLIDLEVESIVPHPFISQEFKGYTRFICYNLIPTVFRDNSWRTMSPSWFPDPMTERDMDFVFNETGVLCRMYGTEHRDKFLNFTTMLILQAKELACRRVNREGLDGRARNVIENTQYQLERYIKMHSDVIADLEGYYSRKFFPEFQSKT